MTSGLGVEVALQSGGRPSSALFGETTARALISFASDEEEAVRRAAETPAVPFRILGRIGGDRLRIIFEGFTLADESVAFLSDTWTSAFSRAMDSADVL
jgi:phosphoribosylformylglycinamidine synthase